MGRVHRAMAKAGDWERMPAPAQPGEGIEAAPRYPGPALYPVVANHPRLAVITGAQDATDDPLVKNRRVATPAERILFKAFRLKYSNVDDRLPAVRMGDEAARGVYRALAVRVSNLAARRDVKTVMITSARDGEGKTTVAANLAASIARLIKGRVLLIDGDVRRSRLGERLGILARFGWGDVIEGLASPTDAIARTEPGGLHVLVNRSQCQPGQSDASDKLVDLLASERPEELLEELKQQFDLIIIDCPCITAYAEAQKLALIADGTIMVVQAGHTDHRTVTDALKLVPKEKRMGIVLNQSEA